MLLSPFITSKIFEVGNPIDNFYREASLFSPSQDIDNIHVRELKIWPLRKPLREYLFHLEKYIPSTIRLHLLGLSGRFKELSDISDKVLKEAYNEGQKGEVHYTLLLKGIFEKSPFHLEMAKSYARDNQSVIGEKLSRFFLKIIAEPDEIHMEDFDEIIQSLREFPELATFSEIAKNLQHLKGLDNIENPNIILHYYSEFLMQLMNTPAKATLWYALMIGGYLNKVWASFSENNTGIYRGIEKIRTKPYFKDALLHFIVFPKYYIDKDRAKTFRSIDELFEGTKKGRHVKLYWRKLQKMAEKWKGPISEEMLWEEFPMVEDAWAFSNLSILMHLRDIQHFPESTQKILWKEYWKHHRDEAGKDIKCPYCGGPVKKFGRINEVQRYRCKQCKRTFLETAIFRIEIYKKLFEKLMQIMEESKKIATFYAFQHLIEYTSMQGTHMRNIDSIMGNPIDYISRRRIWEQLEKMFGAKINKNYFYETFKGIFYLYEFLKCLKESGEVLYIKIEWKRDTITLKITTDAYLNSFEETLNRCWKNYESQNSNLQLAESRNFGSKVRIIVHTTRGEKATL